MDIRVTATLMVLLAATGLKAQEAVIHPEPIFNCLQKVEHQAEANLHDNPYYLRGDFDGDGRPDYAVAIRMPSTRKNGVLICRANGTNVILRPQDRGKPFSDMPDDNFFAPNWSVYTHSSADEIVKSNSRKALIKGEAIAMTWEDAIGLIYWDGSGFRWIGNLQ